MKNISTNQLFRSSKSPCANIAKVNGRYRYQEDIQFYRVARGSLAETPNLLTDALEGNTLQLKRSKRQLNLLIIVSD